MSINQQLSPQQAVNTLNELLELDREAISKMFMSRTSCNKKLADHPTAQCWSKYTDCGKEYGIRSVGVINALFGVFGEPPHEHWGCIAISVDEKDSDTILKFVVLENGKIKVKGKK